MLTEKKNHSSSPEIWGGIECTINRVGDSFFDQLAYSQHYDRDEDMDAICNLGFKSFRYPVLWEKHEAVEGLPIDFSWAESRLNKLREHNIEPIVGLVHHGSGPAFTNLLDESFPYRLAAYAKKVAMQFPWVNYYTPVNEPLTTARFSGLYGLWFPHHSSATSFAKMLLLQMKGIVLSMQAIRAVNPEAKFVQTEDLAKIYSTAKLEYQADFENKRRWLTNDILCGFVNDKHPLWKYFKKQGIKRKELEFFTNNICKPDIIGWNYYVTSERYLDQKIERYPANTHGGNGRHEYADVEAVRVELKQPHGLQVLLNEAWKRYQLPMAITEVHLHCTREEQLRWFSDVYNECQKAIADGVNIKAITAWSVLGAFGWNKLLTQQGGEYEPGVFDIRSGSPRPTALANFIREKNEITHNTYAGEDGWWKRPHRLIYRKEPLTPKYELKQKSSPIMIIGKTGTLGKAFHLVANERCIHNVVLSRQECDLTQHQSILNAIEKYKPTIIVNAAGYVRVDDAENEPDKCFADNTIAATTLSDHCKQKGIRLLSFSSDLVFSGKKNSPYTESDFIQPLSIYGQSKALAEHHILSSNIDALMIRTSAFFGPWDEYNFAHQVIRSIRDGQIFLAADDLIISPTYVPDLVNASLDLLIDEATGLWHLCNGGELSWYDFAIRVAVEAGLSPKLVKPISHTALNLNASRPLYSAMTSEQGNLLPSLDDAIERYTSQVRSRQLQPF